MFLGIIFGYFVSKGAHEELEELSVYLKYSYIVTAALVFAVASYLNLWLPIIVFIITFFLLYFYNGRIAQNAVLFVSGAVIFFVSELFVFSVMLFINLMLLTSINYDKRFVKNAYAYLYFLVPALIVFLLKYFSGV
jgi:hypothetical protein